MEILQNNCLTTFHSAENAAILCVSARRFSISDGKSMNSKKIQSLTVVNSSSIRMRMLFISQNLVIMVNQTRHELIP